MKNENSTVNTTEADATSSNEQQLSIDDYFIADLFNLKVDNIKSIHCFNDASSNNTAIHITLNPTYPSCPHCGGMEPKIKGYYLKKINHSTLINMKLTLHYHERRYVCSYCGKSYYPKNPFTDDYNRHSTLTTINILTDLKKSCTTMSEVAQRHNVSQTTVANVFDQFVDVSRSKLPKFLCIDEVYAFKSNKSKYVCMLLDYQMKTPVEILPSRHYSELTNFFANIPKEERDNVSVFSSDMWDTYQKIAKIFLPNAVRIIDRFHVQAECNKRLDHIRISIQKNFEKKTNEYYLLKKFNWVLYSNDDHLLDVNRKKKYNKKLKRYLNYHDIKCLLQDAHPDLEVAINLKDALAIFYDGIKIVEKDVDPSIKEEIPQLKRKANGKHTKRNQKKIDKIKKRNQQRALTEEEALKEFESLIKRFKECNLIEMSSFASTLNKWKREIVNSLRIYSSLNNDTISNAIIENRNKIIKNVKHNSNGYQNWKRYRNRLMYVLDPKATYRLNADQTIIERKRKKNRANYEKWKAKTGG